MIKTLLSQVSIKNKIIFFLLALIAWVLTLTLFPIQYIQTKESADNPNGCPYYITLKSVLSNYPLNSYDRANAKYIKQRMLQFENDISHTKLTLEKSIYKNAYYLALRNVGLLSIQDANEDALIILAASSAYKPIDSYYLDKNLFCNNPLYTWRTTDSRRILLYNLSSLYDQLPNKFMRILVAEPSGYQLGVFSGFFVNTQSTTLVTQFMTGQPLLTALYVQPKYDFAIVGTYQSLVPWCYFRIEFVTDPFFRKLFNISGMDIFTVAKKDMIKNSVSNISGTTKLYSNINPIFNLGFQSFINHQSYGMAYLANNIIYQNPQDIKESENLIKKYFSKPDHHDPAIFRKVTDYLYANLMKLNQKYDIILEKKSDEIRSRGTDIESGNVEINGIVGERAMFNASCKRKSCFFVFNTADAHGWRAYVNGSISKIYRANYAFMATKIPTGKSIIWFIYAPWANVLSYLISLLALLILLIYSSKYEPTN